MTFERYAVYYTPQGALGEAGASWLGWDISRGQVTPQPVVDGLDMNSATQTPRKYGFHATIKPPFAISGVRDAHSLCTAFADACADIAPITLDGLALTWMGGFLALTPMGGTTALNACAAQMVRLLDPFRAPLAPAELARRQHPRLTETQLRNLQQWGYPHVMESFRFHITLTNRIPRSLRDPVEVAAAAHIAPHLPKSFQVKHLTLVGQGADGLFREIHRAPLGG